MCWRENAVQEARNRGRENEGHRNRTVTVILPEEHTRFDGGSPTVSSIWTIAFR
jgi:hypothetical protein